MWQIPTVIGGLRNALVDNEQFNVADKLSPIKMPRSNGCPNQRNTVTKGCHKQ